ncbi:MAG: hypothetical protein VW518_00215 [Burkholderiaceae bacterium]
MRMLTYNPIPKNKADPIYFYKGLDFTGESYLVNPELLFENAYKYTLREVGTYISLAATRNLANFLATGETTIDTLLLPEDEIIFEEIHNNRLLSIDSEGKLHFLYEEVPQEKIVWH